MHMSPGKRHTTIHGTIKGLYMSNVHTHEIDCVAASPMKVHRPSILQSPTKYKIDPPTTESRTSPDFDDAPGTLFDNDTAFLSKLTNMNQKVKLYKKLFYNKEPFYDADNEVKKQNDRAKREFL